MSSLVRISLNRWLGQHCLRLGLNSNGQQVVRTITSKLDDLPKKPAPFDYKNKGFNQLTYFYDKTSSRFDENTKLIVVEGPVAAGKSKFAKEIAKAFNMLYMPEANLEMIYINDYGFDIRKLDPMLPEDCRTFDVADFLKNPKHKLAARMQIYQFGVKLSQYIDALAHVLSTGQGVILDRCVYSDFVFAEAMASQGFLSKAARKKYYEFRDNILHELLRPHLVIYLDVPVSKVQDNIKKRAIGYERDSIALTPKYLEVMDRMYKQNYLNEISKHADLLVYDWSVEGDMEIVIEDIEAIDFNRFDAQDPQLKDWVYHKEEEWACLRYKYADKKNQIMAFLNIPAFEVPELVVDAMDADTYWNVINNAPGNEYLYGYNQKMGDKGLLLKVGSKHRETLPLRERSVQA